MLPVQQVVSPEQFDRLFQEQAVIAEFATIDQEREYERRDSFLIHLIRREVERSFGSDCGDTVFVHDDWWPNHTRYIDMTRERCTPVFLLALRDLLCDEHREYRMQICVYDDLMDGDSYIGSVAIYADRLLIEERLHDLLALRHSQ